MPAAWPSEPAVALKLSLRIQTTICVYATEDLEYRKITLQFSSSSFDELSTCRHLIILFPAFALGRAIGRCLNHYVIKVDLVESCNLFLESRKLQPGIRSIDMVTGFGG